jgi:hypothetical protein
MLKKTLILSFIVLLFGFTSGFGNENRPKTYNRFEEAAPRLGSLLNQLDKAYQAGDMKKIGQTIEKMKHQRNVIRKKVRENRNINEQPDSKNKSLRRNRSVMPFRQNRMMDNFGCSDRQSTCRAKPLRGNRNAGIRHFRNGRRSRQINRRGCGIKQDFQNNRYMNRMPGNHSAKPQGCPRLGRTRNNAGRFNRNQYPERRGYNQRNFPWNW